MFSLQILMNVRNEFAVNMDVKTHLEAFSALVHLVTDWHQTAGHVKVRFELGSNRNAAFSELKTEMFENSLSMLFHRLIQKTQLIIIQSPPKVLS
jgi:hypothetical protein